MSSTSRPNRRPPVVARGQFLVFGILGITLLVALTSLGYMTISQLRTALLWRERSTEVRGEIRLARIDLSDMEAGQRGFLLTGDRAYLAPYTTAVARIDGDLATLAKLIGDNPAQQRSLTRLRELAREKQAELQRTIDLRTERGYEAARKVAASATGLRLMDDMRSMLTDMEGEEVRLLAERRSAESKSLRGTTILASLFGVLLAVLLGAIYYLLRREMAIHVDYESSLAAANAELEGKVRERTRSLQESEARLNGIVEGAPDAIISIDETQAIVLANPAAARMFGHTEEEMRGAALSTFIPERYRAAHNRHVDEFGASPVVTRRMSSLRVVHGLRRDGTEFPIDASISQVRISGKKLYTVILRDITDEYRAKNELEQSRRELRELTSALEYVQEEERKRIAQELHDDLGQQLTVMKMDAALIRSRLGPEQRDALRVAERLESVLTRTVQSVRRISTALRPAMLDDLGLVPALEELVQHIAQHSGLACRLNASEDLDVRDDLSTPLYRVAQESLNNAVKHAQATEVTVALFENDDSALVLTIEDNGVGIAPGDPRKRKSFGLIGMRERIYALGGEFAVRSAPRAGTTIEVRIPLPPDAARRSAGPT